MNNFYIQLQGPFAKGEDLLRKIKIEHNSNFKYIARLGIQTGTSKKVRINEKVFTIGKTEILQFNDVRVTSLSFEQDEDEFTLVDCVLE